MKQHGQDFFGIWQHPRERTTCIIPNLDTGQIHARLEDVTLCFLDESPMR